MGLGMIEIEKAPAGWSVTCDICEITHYEIEQSDAIIRALEHEDHTSRWDIPAYSSLDEKAAQTVRDLADEGVVIHDDVTSWCDDCGRPHIHCQDGAPIGCDSLANSAALSVRRDYAHWAR